jgi:hypothetical protein
MVSHANGRCSDEGPADDAPASDVLADERDVTLDGKPTNKNVAAENAPEARTTRSNPDGRTDNSQILLEFRLGAGPRTGDRSPRVTRPMRWLAGIPVAAAGIDRSAPDDVPGLADSRDTDATLANDANDTPPADTPDYSNELEEKLDETTARTLLKDTNASHADEDSHSRSLDRSP